MIRLPGALLFAATVMLVSSGSVLACSCGGDSRKLSEREIKAAIAKEFNESPMVFSGEVVAQDTFKVKFKLITVWKGDAFQELNMSTGTKKLSENYYRSSSCDYGFKVGQKYLVYARLTEDYELVARSCTRTNLLANGEKDIPELNLLNPSAYQVPRAEPVATFRFFGPGEIQRVLWSGLAGE